jgi:hypothetical protein
LLTVFGKEGGGFSAGRWAGVLLVSVFGLYIGAIAYGIQRGAVIAPEASDSDSDASDQGTDDEDEIADADRGQATTQSSIIPGSARE